MEDSPILYNSQSTNTKGLPNITLDTWWKQPESPTMS